MRDTNQLSFVSAVYNVPRRNFILYTDLYLHLLYFCILWAIKVMDNFEL